MTVALINDFSGGLAEDIRDHVSAEAADVQNFDVFTNAHYMLPYPDSVEELVNGDSAEQYELGEVAVCSLVPSATFVTVGYQSAVSAAPQFMFKTEPTDGWATAGYGTGTDTFQKGTLVIYKDLPYCVTFNSGTTEYILEQLTDSATVTNVGSVILTPDTLGYCKPFVHPEDNILYMGFGYVIAKWDGVTFTAYNSIIPIDMNIMSITNYGTYLAIACSPRVGNGKSTTFLWGRDGTINTLQGNIDCGEGTIQIVENIQDYLVIVMTPWNYRSTTFNNKLLIKIYAGGPVQTVKSLQISNRSNLSFYKFKNQDKLYFALSPDNCVYVVGKNKNGRWIVSKDRFIFNGENIGNGINGISIVGDTMWIGFFDADGDAQFYRSTLNYLGETQTFSNTSIYRTTINPGMGLSRYTIQDRHKVKSLSKGQLMYTGFDRGNINLIYSIDGSDDTRIINQATDEGEGFIEVTSDLNGDPFLSGKEFTFQIESTGGVKIKELDYDYQPLESQI